MIGLLSSFDLGDPGTDPGRYFVIMFVFCVGGGRFVI